MRPLFDHNEPIREGWANVYKDGHTGNVHGRRFVSFRNIPIAYRIRVIPKIPVKLAAARKAHKPCRDLSRELVWETVRKLQNAP